jgi:REP element-mobilizing transposase RayT
MSLDDGIGSQRHFLTISTHRRRKHFARPEFVELTLVQILRAAHQDAFVIPAYCFMPDHLPVLVEAESEGSEFQGFVRLAKQFSGYEFRKVTGERLWKPSYWDAVRMTPTDPPLAAVAQTDGRPGL